MANANQITGSAEIYIDGIYYPSTAGAKLTPGAVQRDEVSGDRVHGFTEKAMAPRLECEFAHKGSITIAALNNVTNATIVFASDNGRTFTLRNAWSDGQASLSADGGKISATFKAIACDEG